MLANYSVTSSDIDTKGINYFHIKILHLAFLHCAGPETDHVTDAPSRNEEIARVSDYGLQEGEYGHDRPIF